MKNNKSNNKNNNLFINIYDFFLKLQWYNILISIVTFCIICFVIVSLYTPNYINWQIGDKATKTIISKNYVSYRDFETENYIKNQIISDTIGYVDNNFTLSEHISNLNKLFEKIIYFKTHHKDFKNLNKEISPYTNGKLPQDTLNKILNLTPQDIIIIQKWTIQTSAFILENELKDDTIHMQKAYKRVEKYLNSHCSDKKYISIIYDIVINTLIPTKIYSEDTTKLLINQKLKEIPEIYQTVKPGDVVVKRGEIIDKNIERKLINCGFYKNKVIFYKNIAGIILLIAFGFLYVLIFLNKYKIIIHDVQQALLFSIILIGTLLGFWISSSMMYNNINTFIFGYIAIMWLVAAIMLIYYLLSKYLSMFILVFVSLVIGYAFGNDIRVTSIALITGMCAVWAVSKVNARIELIKIYFLLVLATIIQVFIFGLLYSEPFTLIFNEQIKYVIFIIPSSTLIFYIFSGILERAFNLSTEMRLLELSNANNSLLKNLAMKAPGTYTHSISVSFISEACAEAIGANALLTKVGALYHDIGKLNNPQFFIENQYSENVHNELSPQLSVMVIRSHVKIGVEYAKKYMLPTNVINIIKEHHGTTLVSYFFHQFNDENTSIVNIESQFRYEGPKPQTKEAAILMICDSCEAASRSLKNPTPNKIETLVNSIVSGKLSDGQFNECPLTLSDISNIKLSIIKSLLHIMHRRIEYPTVNKQKEDKD